MLTRLRRLGFDALIAITSGLEKRIPETKLCGKRFAMRVNAAGGYDVLACTKNAGHAGKCDALRWPTGPHTNRP